MNLLKINQVEILDKKVERFNRNNLVKQKTFFKFVLQIKSKSDLILLAKRI